MTGLLMPRHVAAQRLKEKTAVSAVANSISRSSTNRLSSDEFASGATVQEQLDQLRVHIEGMRERDAEYRIPRPSGWRLTVLMLTIPEVSDGGVFMVDDEREARAMASPQGVILEVGMAAYTDPTRFRINNVMTPWHKPGDRIIWTRYDATSFHLANGQRIGFMNDTQPAGLIDDGWDVSFTD